MTLRFISKIFRRSRSSDLIRIKAVPPIKKNDDGFSSCDRCGEEYPSKPRYWFLTEHGEQICFKCRELGV